MGGVAVYISADLEGVAGVVSPGQLTTGPGYETARRRQTREVAAAVRGARAGGAGRILINDAHEGMMNLLLDQLPVGVAVVSGRPKALGMMNGIDGGFDLAFFLGYHPRQGTPGTLSHSFSSRLIRGLWLNGTEVGELGLNAALAGWFGVPVVLVSGDAALAGEAAGQLVGTEFVVVKEPVSQQAAQTMLPATAATLIETRAREVVTAGNAGQLVCTPWRLPQPFRLTVAFHQPVMADVVTYMPGVRRSDPCRVEYVHEAMPVVYKAFQAMLVLAGSVAG
ncbi:MAG: M55 family metallopeptidase [Heliobacteriaceae bacterium]|nr:M55 family metallopeptidase [Heliobacteriaceae bacterium]MDD4588030.1 M55 family metallopeptidase [Heliobacteriaceae bacterium]